MATSFSGSNARPQDARTLKPHHLLHKYILGWHCSVCGLYFELSGAERKLIEDGYDVPQRIRYMFENHRCGRQDLCCVRQRPSSAFELPEK